MLLQMRNFSRSWVAIGLIVILAATFVLFLGNGQSILDTLQVSGANYVAKVGGRQITPTQLDREIDLYLRQMRNQNNTVTRAEAIETGQHLQRLESLIARAALASYADKLGVSASNVQVGNRIREIPAVQNALSGSFDEAAYDQFLNGAKYSRPEFEAEIRNGLTADMLMEALTVGSRAPSSFGALLLAFESERRVVSIAEAPAALAGQVPQPNEAQIAVFYEESAAQLQVPEYRVLTLVRAHPQDFLARVSVPEERLRAEFESRRGALTTPERRSFVRLAASSEAQARDAVARLARGEAPEAAARALGVPLTQGAQQTREQIADSLIAEAVFTMTANMPARAVRGQLTPWAVVKVTAVTPAVLPVFASVREQLRQEIALEQAGELLSAAIGSFEEARAGGASLAEAARATGLPTTTLPPIDAQGRTQQGQQIEALPADLVEMAFETPEGEASDFMPLGDADVVIAVDRVLPSATRALEDVRPQLIAAWIARERAIRLRALGAEIAAAVAGGQSFAAAVRARRMNMIVSSRETDRRGAAQIPARQLAPLIFSAREGEVLSDLRADGGALLVTIVERIQRADPAQSPELVEAGRTQMQQALDQSVGEAIQGEIIARGQAQRNNRLIQQRYSSANGENESPP